MSFKCIGLCLNVLLSASSKTLLYFVLQGSTQETRHVTVSVPQIYCDQTSNTKDFPANQNHLETYSSKPGFVKRINLNIYYYSS